MRSTSPRAAGWPCFSTTVPSPGPWPSRVCSVRERTWPNAWPGPFPPRASCPQLVHIATDGETYGHHQRFGDMALTYALQYIESENLARLTNYGEYLERHPPMRGRNFREHLLELRPRGGALAARLRLQQRRPPRLGTRPGAPRCGRPWTGSGTPWPPVRRKGRAISQRPLGGPQRLYPGHPGPQPGERGELPEPPRLPGATGEDKVTVLKLMGVQRSAMLMYTSCGWFFDELSGIETVQVIHYAGRALQTDAGYRRR